MSPTSRFTYRRRVEFADTDTAGVAHFAVFYRYMEEAEHALYRALGERAYRWGSDRVEGMPRVAASCEFLAPARYGDELEITLLVREARPRSIRYEAEIDRVGDGKPREPIARGSMTVVHAERAHGSREWRAAPIPGTLAAQLEVAPSLPGEGTDVPSRSDRRGERADGSPPD